MSAALTPRRVGRLQRPRLRVGVALMALAGGILPAAGVVASLAVPRAAVASTPPMWQQRSQGAPYPDGLSLAFDPVRHAYVAFDTAGRTWFGDGSTWLRRPTAAAPPPRRFATMAFDGNAMILFGGQDASRNALGDTWTFDGTTWTQLDPSAPHPPARWGQSMTRDEGPGGGVVLFGGIVPGTTLCALQLPAAPCPFDTSTWVWNGHGWVEFPGSAPPPRFDAAMAFDRVGGDVVLFGGVSTLPITGFAFLNVGVSTGLGPDLNDTWAWDRAHGVWAQQASSAAATTGPPSSSQLPVPGGGPAASVPRARSQAAMAPDPGGALLVGGIDGNGNLLGDTWRWDGRGWTALTNLVPSPTARQHPTMASAGAGALLFGGTTCPDGLRSCGPAVATPNPDAAWGWNGSAWSALAGQPSPRDLSSATFDAVGPDVLLFGGRGADQYPDQQISLGDTWTWSGSAWSARAAPGPDRSFGASLAPFPATSSSALLYNGTGWAWSGNGWSGQNTAFPPGRSEAAMAYDAFHRQVVLFGGTASGQPLGDTWIWDGTRWTQATPAASPPPRWGATMAYDSVHQRIVLFGGYGDDGVSPDKVLFNDTWTWDGTTWTTTTPATAPAPRVGASMTYDPAIGRAVLFGGIGCPNPAIRCSLFPLFDQYPGGVPLGDLWSWDGSSWSSLNTANPPAARANASLTYDPALQQLVLFGGNIAPQDSNLLPADLLDDTWTLDPGASPPGLAASLSPSPLSFSGEPVGSPASPLMVVVTNTGTSPLAIAPGGITSSSPDFVPTSLCPATLASGASCAVMVTFTPSAAGARSATLSVADNAPGSPQTVALSGAGLPALGGTASAVYLQGVTLLGAVAPQHIADGGQGICQAGPVLGAAPFATGTGSPLCELGIPDVASGRFTGTVAHEQVTGTGTAASAESSLASLTLLPGMGPGGVDVLDATALDGKSSASCTGGGTAATTASSNIARLSIAGQTVATQPVGSQIVLDPTGGRPGSPGYTRVYGSPLVINPTGGRIPMAVVTLNYSRHDVGNNTEVSSPLEVEFPARGPLSSLIVGRVFIAYAASSATHCR